MPSQESDQSSTLSEWVAKSTRARALAEALEEKARTRPADRPHLLELVRKLGVGASIFERRVRKAQTEGGKPSFHAPSESPSDSLPDVALAADQVADCEKAEHERG